MITKKPGIILLCLFLALSMSGCGKTEPTVKSINKYGVEYIIDTENRTIRTDQYTYTYTIDSSELTITYPDGETYTSQRKSNGDEIGGTSLHFDFSKYDDPLTLSAVVREATNTGGNMNHQNTGVGIVLLLIGIVCAVWPNVIWFLNWGWRYKNAEPSDLALGLYRFGGIIVAGIGLFLIIS